MIQLKNCPVLIAQVSIPLCSVKESGVYVRTLHWMLISPVLPLPLVLLDGAIQRRGCRSTMAQPLSVSDRATVHLELADAHLLLGQDREAALVMEGAVKEFAGTGEEMR